MTAHAASLIIFQMALHISSGLRLPDGPNSKNKRVDTVIVVKTLDTGSTFLDQKVFPNVAHVSRWAEEVDLKIAKEIEKEPLNKVAHALGLGFEKTQNMNKPFEPTLWRKVLEWFKHKPGEEVVGASINISPRWVATTDFWSSLSSVVPGKFLFIKLNRNYVDKWVSIMRRGEYNARGKIEGCDKTNMHTPECEQKKGWIDPEGLFRLVRDDHEVNTRLDQLMANITQQNPQLFSLETYHYDDIKQCQGIPKRINTYFGNDADQCEPYVFPPKTMKHKDLIENFDEVFQKFQGTEYEQFITK